MLGSRNPIIKYSSSEQCGEAGFWFFGAGPGGRWPLQAQRRHTAQWSSALELVFIQGEKMEKAKYADIFLRLPRRWEIRRPLSSRRLIILARFILAFLIKKTNRQSFQHSSVGGWRRRNRLCCHCSCILFSLDWLLVRRWSERVRSN